MEVRLLPHQIIGVSWMVRQELEFGLKGGILADEMGLWVFSFFPSFDGPNPIIVGKPCR